MEMLANSNDSGPRSATGNTITITDGVKQLWESFHETKDYRKSHGIHRVPWCLRGSRDISAFKPRLVSIGPYHHGESHLQPMQSHKYGVLHCMLEKYGKDMSQLLDVVRNLEHKARACYEDLSETSFPSEIFVEMLLLDGCFVLYFLTRSWSYDNEDDDPIFSKYYMCARIYVDMIMLENQIPVFILNELFEVLENRPHSNGILDLIFTKFNVGVLTGRGPTSDSNNVLSSPELQNASNNILTCLEVLRESFMYDSTTKEYTTKMVQQREEPTEIDHQQCIVPSVTALKEAGVVLRHKKTTPIWDIEFKKGGVLEIPQIWLCEQSETIFLNLMAFELCNVNEQKYRIISYVLFMNVLVNSTSDVTELRAQGVIAGGLTDEKIADIFNHLGKRTFLPLLKYYEDLSRQIHKYCNKRHNRWRDNLMHNYFNNPWAIISVIAAAFLLLLTIVQTWYTIDQYYLKS